jgi:hypothetical protein
MKEALRRIGAGLCAGDLVLVHCKALAAEVSGFCLVGVLDFVNLREILKVSNMTVN